VSDADRNGDASRCVVTSRDGVQMAAIVVGGSVDSLLGWLAPAMASTASPADPLSESGRSWAPAIGHQSSLPPAASEIA